MDLRVPSRWLDVYDSPLKFQMRAVKIFPDEAGYLVSSIEGRVAVRYFQDETSVCSCRVAGWPVVRIYCHEGGGLGGSCERWRRATDQGVRVMGCLLPTLQDRTRKLVACFFFYLEGGRGGGWRKYPADSRRDISFYLFLWICFCDVCTFRTHSLLVPALVCSSQSPKQTKLCLQGWCIILFYFWLVSLCGRHSKVIAFKSARTALQRCVPPSTPRYGQQCHRKKPQVYSVNALSFHKPYGTFATAGSDGAFNTWDLEAKWRVKAFPSYDRFAVVRVVVDSCVFAACMPCVHTVCTVCCVCPYPWYH